jgi:hypothetical protein
MAACARAEPMDGSANTRTRARGYDSEDVSGDHVSTTSTTERSARRAVREPSEDQENDQRLDRLIAAMESQANAINRLVQTLEGKKKRRTDAAATRRRRAVIDKPITITPMVEAAVKRTLARVSR